MPTVLAWSITYVVVRLMVGNGASVPVATNTILVTLIAIALLELVLALPLFRYRRELAKFATTSVRPKRLDPFYATKVLALAKATSIAAALFLGTAFALVFMQLGAPVVADSILFNFIGLVESLILIFVALAIERACKIKDDGETQKDSGSTAPEATA